MRLSHSAVMELTAESVCSGSESSVSQLEIGPRTHARRRRHTHRGGTLTAARVGSWASQWPILQQGIWKLGGVCGAPPCAF